MTKEEILIDYMRRFYTDENLAALLAHAEDGKLSFNSCCCFIGIPTANHALQGAHAKCPDDFAHTNYARGLDGSVGDLAEDAFMELGDDDIQRRERIIPLIHEEIERRDRERSESSTPTLVTTVMK